MHHVSHFDLADGLTKVKKSNMLKNVFGTMALSGLVRKRVFRSDLKSTQKTPSTESKNFFLKVFIDSHVT